VSQKGADGLVRVKFAVAGLAIEAVKFKMFVKLRKADKALEGGLAHLGDIFELHVIGDEGLDLIGVVIREAEAAAEGIGHADAHADMIVEADAVAGFRGWAKSGRFANVVKQNAPGKRRRGSGGKAFEHEEGVDPDVTFGMELRRLGDAFHGGDFGQQFRKEAEFVEELEATAGGAFGEEFGEFFSDALGGDDMDFICVPADGGESGGFDGVSEASRKPDGAEHAEFVFGETAGGIADGADDFSGEIGATADEVENFAGVVAHEEAVDGEIAALNVFFR
jgi:hypothetical protein